MANYGISEKKLKEEVGKQCEVEFQRLSNNLLKQVTDKYETMVQENLTSEIDKVNESILSQCPTKGAIVLVLDKNEVTVPFTDLSRVKITGIKEDLSEDKSFELGYEDLSNAHLMDIISFTLGTPFVRFDVTTGREVELYDKDAFEKENKVVKYAKKYETKYSTLLNTRSITSIYLVNASLN